MKRYLIGGLLFVAGLLILAYPHLARLVNNQLQENTITTFHQELEQLTEEERVKKVELANQCNERISQQGFGMVDPFDDGASANNTELCGEISTLKTTNVNVFATLEIPKLNLVLPIYLGASEKELSKGVGQIEGSSLPIGGENTHTLLAGHRGMATQEMFQHVDRLSPGDLFYIHTINGTLTYRVYAEDIILPSDTQSLNIQDHKDLATLVTCHPYGSNKYRLLIRGERVKSL